MTQKTIQGNADLAKQIRLRRSELAGESIRSDKCKGVCKALNWLSLPGQESRNAHRVLS